MERAAHRRPRPARGAPGTRTELRRPGARTGPGGGRRPALAAVATVLAGLLSVAPVAAQQVQELDAGRFAILLDGSRIGTESFAIRREGNAVKAVGRITPEPGTDLSALEVRLQTGPDFRPNSYALRSQGGSVDRVDGVWSGDRLRLHLSTEAGERWKEFLTRGGVVVLEPGVAHHYDLLFRQLPPDPVGSTVAAIIPSRNEQLTVRVTGSARESVEAGGTTVDAVRYDLEIDGERRSAWLDDGGRLVRVAVPDRSRTYVRLPDGEG